MDVHRVASLLLVLWIGVVSARPSPGNQTRGAGKIVGGVDADIAAFPHQVSLRYWDGSAWKHYCGGSIISTNYILTAAHCLPNTNERVFAGITLLSEDVTGVKIRKVRIHGGYNSDTNNNDIAVIKLKTHLVYNANIGNVALPARDDCPYLTTGSDVAATGWGTTEESGELANTLQKVTVQVKDRTQCNAIYSGGITKGMMCASAAGKDSCQGDSGGPLVDIESGRQFGITSWGYGCARPDFPGVYTRICKYRKWIYKKTGRRV